MNIAINKMIALSYVLRAESAEGEIIEQTTPDNLLKFVYGVGAMIPKFEENLMGLKQGDPFEMLISAKDAYGEVDPEAVVDLPKEIFLLDGVFDEERFKAGEVVPMQSADGQRMNGTIMEVGESSLKMDFNHPLAGINLYFTGDILEVRDATEEELSPSCGCGCGNCGSGDCEGGDGSSNCGCNGGGCC